MSYKYSKNERLAPFLYIEDVAALMELIERSFIPTNFYSFKNLIIILFISQLLECSIIWFYILFIDLASYDNFPIVVPSDTLMCPAI